MIAALRISSSLGRIAENTANRAESVIASIGRLPSLKGIKFKPVIDALQHDKKVRDGALHFILPRDIGHVEVSRDVPIDLVRETVKALIDESKTRR
jgi:3-dehydroquinate synthase